MTYNKIKYLFLAFIFIITGCKDFSPVQPILDNYSVMAFITNDTAAQKIYVYRTTILNTNNPTDYFNTDYFYDKAAILISDERNYFSFRFIEDKYGNKYYLNSKVDFKPGATYKLNLKTETGTITGKTTLPGDFEITSYKDGQEIFADKSIEINLNWSRSYNASAYIINVKLPIESPWWDYYYMNYSYVTNGTSFNFSDNTLLPSLDSTHFSIISVTAVDRNFYRHYFEEYNSSGIDRGYGYFGSGTVKTIKLKIKLRE